MTRQNYYLLSSQRQLMIIRDLKNSKKIIGEEGTIICDLINPIHVENKIRYSISHATLSSGKSSKHHKMKTTEIYYILEGEGIMHINNESRQVNSGQAIYIPPTSTQYIENTGKSDLKFLCIVDPAWKKEDEMILDECVI